MINKLTKTFVLFNVIFALSLASPVLGHAGESDYNMMGDYSMGLYGWIFMLLTITALVLLVVWLIKQTQEPKRRKKNGI